MEVAGAAGGEVTKCAIVHIEREVGYLVHFRRNTNDLKSKAELLKAQTTDVERLIHAAENNNNDVRVSVRTWLEKARNECDQATHITNKAERIISCFAGWCCLRFSLGRKAEKKVVVIQDLLDRRNEFANVVSDPKPTQSLELLPTGDFEDFASRGASRDRIIQSLKEDKTQLIGVWGMPGVGKTMLAKKIAKKVKKESLFKDFVWVTVSQNPDLKTIQGAIANELDLKLEDGHTVDLRARRLSERLKNSNKVLVILEDIWERVELNELGIPCGDESRGCKVLFTTRIDDVCNAMETQEMIQVQVLSEPESWHLFRLKASDLVDSLEFQQVATDIVSECGGLPLAIVTLGRALRNKKKSIWDSTLLQLQKSIFDGNSRVFSSIRLSYNFLPDKKTKLCFLFWCFFPEDYAVRFEELLSYQIGEKLLRDVETLEEARAELHLMVDSLVSMCLLQRDEEGGLMMHDVVRDVAVLIASEEGQGFVLKVISPLSQWSDIGLDNCKRLSLILKSGHFDSSEIQPRFPPLPYQIRAPQLVTLSLSGSGLDEIPPDFFRETKNILTLHLSYTGITSLPPSISFLVNLCTLRLEWCRNLKTLSPIEKLEKLEILVLINDTELEFPKEIRGLSNFRLLDLSYTLWDVGLSPEVISSLSRLEELYMMCHSYRRGDDGYDSILSAIRSLNRLTHLELFLKLNEYLSELFSTDWGRLSPEMIHRWKNLKKFKLSINDILFVLTADRCFNLTDVSFPIVNNFVQVMMCRATFLSVYRCRDFKNVVQVDQSVKLFGMEVDQSVKLFGMEGCEEMPYLITNVQELELKGMYNLVAICDGNGNAPLQGFFNKLRVLRVESCYGLIKLTSSPTFSNIRSITVAYCDEMKNLFPITVVRHLLHLETIYINNCLGLEEIIADDSSDQGSDINVDKDKAILPRLTRLEVSWCGQLHSFCPPGLLVHWPSLNELKVTRCPTLKRLPFGTDNVPKLASLDVDRDGGMEWFNKLEWNDESIKSRLQLLIVDKT